MSEPPADSSDKPPEEPTSPRTPLETIYILQHHGERLLAAITGIRQKLDSADFQFLASREARKLGKNKVAKDPKLNAYFTQARVAQWGHQLRPAYAIAAHLFNFQKQAIAVLVSVSRQTSDADLSWNYTFAWPVVELFLLYCKLILYIPEAKMLPTAVLIYRACLLRVGGNDPQAGAVLEFLQDRAASWKSLESEIHPLEDFLMGFFHPVLPSLQLAIGPPSSFPWKSLNLIDKPKVNLVTETWFRAKFILLMHLTEICEAFLIVGMLLVQRLQDPGVFADTWVLAHAYVGTIHVHADVNVEIRPIVQAMRKQKNLKDMDLTFLDTVEAAAARQRGNQQVKWRRMSLLLRDFAAATEIDPDIMCSHYGLCLSLLGFASFELVNALKRNLQQQPKPWEPRDICELIYHFVALNGRVARLMPALRRFFIYNLHEFDSHYLDTIIHSYSLPMEIFQGLDALIAGLRSIDIEEYDNGTFLDLSPAASLVDSISVDFNVYSMTRGTSHLTSLLHLLSGLSLRMELYQDGLIAWLRISKVHQFWQYLETLSMIIGKHFNELTAGYHAIILHIFHFFRLDEEALSEIADLSVVIKKAFEKNVGLIAQTVFSSFKELQDMVLEKSPIADENPKDLKRRLRGADTLLQRTTFTLITIGQIGTISVIDVEWNIAGELRNQLVNMLKVMILRDKANYAPLELRRRVEVARWSFQQICAAAHINFTQALLMNLSALSSADEQLGSLAVHYRDQYVSIAKDVLPHAFFSNTQEMFVSVNAKPVAGAGPPSVAAAYMSLPALHALRDLIGQKGCLVIYNALTEVAIGITRELSSAFVKILAGPANVYDTGILQVQDPGALIRQLGHVCAVLRLRDMMRPFTDQPRLENHDDPDLCQGLANSPIFELIEHASAVTLFASLLGNAYWECFDYDVAHDAIKDNSHLWARFFDLFVTCASKSRTRITPDLFYRQLFLQSLTSIHKARDYFAKNKKVQYPGLELVILVDHIVSESHYANYSQLEQYVAYQFVRSLYTAKLSRIGGQ